MTLHVTALVGGYGGRAVVDGVDLEVAAGEVVSVLGPSGSGKTTLLRMIAGLHPVDAGSVRLAGREVSAVPVHRRGMGLVPQEGALFPRRTVAANIAYGLGGVSARGAARHPEVRRLLALLQMQEFAERMPHELSGGQRQRVAVARALAPRPSAVLLDEPFNALDAALRIEVRDGVLALLRDAGVATLLITHDRAEAFAAADRTAVFAGGRVAQIDAAGAVYRHPVSAEVARLTGEVLTVPAAWAGGGVGFVSVRPGQVVADAASPTRLPVRRVRDEGERIVLELTVPGGGEVAVAASPYLSGIRAGDEVRVRVDGSPIDVVP